MRIGIMEVIVIIVIALALLSPDKLEDCAVTLAKALRSFTKVRQEVDDEVVKPMKDAIQDVQDAVVETSDELKGGNG